MIALFTDFGWQGPYVGQMHAVFAADANPPAVIDLMHDAPGRNPRAAAHLLAALSTHLPAGMIVVAVVDPGVGTERRPLVVRADDRWYVGPDNGLLDVVSARAGKLDWWEIDASPLTDSATFHGRDLFAPVAARIARAERSPGRPIEPGFREDASDELAEVIYIDAFGNAMTGLRAAEGSEGILCTNQGRFHRGRTFADAEPGDPLWLVNSIGLVEIVVNQGSAAEQYDLAIGRIVHWYDAGPSSQPGAV